jgi:hypothetical protein
MTVVIAKRFDQAICLVSDTMISDHTSGKANRIPGRLKIITLSPNFTVAYAGHANQALDAIRGVHGVLGSVALSRRLNSFVSRVLIAITT